MSPQKMNRISVALLSLGLGGALVVFLTAEPVVVDPLLGDPSNDKKYLYEMARIGGSANVLGAQFTHWFSSLWHGPALAGTLAVLTVLATLVFRFVAARPGFVDVLLARDEADASTTTGEK